MRDLSDAEVSRLQALLDELAAAVPQCSPLDASALDGYLCGVLLQPQALPESRWWPFVVDSEGRALPGAGGARAATTLAALLPLVRRRHAVLAEAIAARQWFDPWVFELHAAAGVAGDEPSSPRESALPWVGGFALAADSFPALMRHDAQALAEPLALLYQHFEREDLEGLDEEPQLSAALAELEPPADLAEAAEDLVRAVLLLADISRPPAPRTAPARASPAPSPRSRSARPARARRG